jgi:hypothetical protein
MVAGTIDRFNVHPVLMLTYLQPKDVDYRQDRKEEPDIGSFDSILRKQFNTVKAIPKK